MATETVTVRFEIYDGSELVRKEDFAEATIKIGKLPSSHVRLDDESISRMHAVVQVNGPLEVNILDFGSATGTFVNDERINKQLLKTGDQIQVGRYTLGLTILDQDGEAIHPPAPKPKGRSSTGGSAHAAPRPTATAVPYYDDEEVPGGERTLEVLTLLGATVMDVVHLAPMETYFIGGVDVDVQQYADPKLVGSEPYLLAENQDGVMVVNVPKTVDGQVLLGEDVYSIAQLAEAGKLSRSDQPNSHALRLPNGARCRLIMGNVSFLVSSVPASQHLPPPQPFSFFDGQLLKYIFSASLLHLLVFILVLSMPEDADRLSLDGFDMSDRFVDFILKPEEERRKELSDLFKDLKEEMEQAKKAKEDQGKMGDRNEKDSKKRFAVEGPQDQKEIELARERAKKEAIDTAQAAFNELEGQLSAVWGTSDKAIGNDAISALGNIYGDKIGAANGFGGLGMAGVGRGGGGFGDSSIGVGTVGTAGRGGGRGGYGKGVGRVGDRKTKQPKVIPGKPVITGGLDREIIRRVIRRHRKEYQYCYEKELQRKKDLNGKIKIKFIISGQGKVIAAQVEESTMNNPSVEGCVVRKIKRWVFPEPKGGTMVTVRYPFIFKSS